MKLMNINEDNNLQAVMKVPTLNFCFRNVIISLTSSN